MFQVPSGTKEKFCRPCWDPIHHPHCGAPVIAATKQRKNIFLNSNNHPSAYDYQPSPRSENYSQRPPVNRTRAPEVMLKELFVQVERKLFVFELKQNERGRFLRLTEEVGARHTTVIIPSTGLQDLHQALGEMIVASDSLPLPPA